MKQFLLYWAKGYLFFISLAVYSHGVFIKNITNQDLIVKYSKTIPAINMWDDSPHTFSAYLDSGDSYKTCIYSDLMSPFRITIRKIIKLDSQSVKDAISKIDFLDWPEDVVDIIAKFAANKRKLPLMFFTKYWDRVPDEPIYIIIRENYQNSGSFIVEIL